MKRLLLVTAACGPLACTTLVGLRAAPTRGDDVDGGMDIGGRAVAEASDETDAGDETDADAIVDAPGRTDGDAVDADSNEPAETGPFDGGADAGPPPLVPGTAPFVLGGITSDGNVVYENPGVGCYAVSSAGGAPVLIAPAPSDGYTVGMSIQGTAAFLSHRNAQTGGWLYVWTSAGGSHLVPGSTLTMSSDGARLAYVVTNPVVDGSASTISLVEANLDLSNALTVATVQSNIDWLFVGVDRFVFETLLLANGGYTDTTDSYASDGGKTHLWDNHGLVGVAGGETLSHDAQDNTVVRSVDGGPIVTLALPTNGTDGGASAVTAKMTPDGSRVVILDNLQNFWTSPTSSAAVVALPGTGGLAQEPSSSSSSPTPILMAPDGSHFIFQDTKGSGWAASTTAGHANSIHTVAGASVTRATFSSDSRYVLFNAGSALQLAGADTAMPVEVASDATCDVGVCWLPAHGSKIVYISGGDLWVADADDATHPQKLARSVVQFVLNAAGTVAAYRFKDSSTDDRSGLFVVAVP